MRILVTGAAGFIGSHLVRTLCQQGHEVHALDSLIETTYSAEIKKLRWQYMKENYNAMFYEKDLRYDEIEDIIASVDIIVNEAGIPGLMMSWANLEVYSQCNVVAVGKLLEVLKKFPTKRLVHISTSSVYGLNALGDEAAETRPISPYGVTKLAAEKLIHAYASEFDLDFVILRYYSIFGPGQRPDMGYSIFIDSILNDVDIKVFGDGRQIRSNTFISDCIDGTILAIQRGKNGETYNISGGEEVSVLEVLEALGSFLGKSPSIQFLPGRPGDQFKTSGNWQKASRDLGYRPKIDIKSGLKLQAEAFQDSRFF
jgi:nucleoside-diphosphate-sugar epimerase